MQGVETFGPPELVSEEIDPQVAKMVNFLFNMACRAKIIRGSVRMILPRGLTTVMHSLWWSAIHRY